MTIHRGCFSANAFKTIALLIFSGACVCWGQANAPQHVSLQDAIQLSRTNEVNFASAIATERSARIDAYLAKTGLLPSVSYHNQVLYTQPNGQTNQGGQAGTQASPIFIANNAIHEYTSQASIDERIGLRQFSDAEVASANAARAAAELEVARRGLVSTVVSLYYSVSTSDRKQILLTQALIEAQAFTATTQKREAAREVAHADVVKALLQQQQKQRDLSDAIVAAQKAKLELAVLLFPDPRTQYTTDFPSMAPGLPTHDEVNRLASERNPEIRSALAGLKAADASVKSAKAAYLPDVALNFTYGIDAPQFARRGPEDVKNLGYSISGTLDIPVWDWFSTQKKIKQSQIQRDVAKVTLTAAQRRLVANLEEAYAEAVTSRDQLTLLEQSVKTAEESLGLTKLRYAAGESTALEVVDAQNAFLSAGTAQADGQVRYESALAALQVLTGTI
jgi:outer membrane protein